MMSFTPSLFSGKIGPFAPELVVELQPLESMELLGGGEAGEGHGENETGREFHDSAGLYAGDRRGVRSCISTFPALVVLKYKP